MKRCGLLLVVLIATAIPLGGESWGAWNLALAARPRHKPIRCIPARSWVTIHDPEDVEVCEHPSDCAIDIRAVSKRHFTTSSRQRSSPCASMRTSCGAGSSTSQTSSFASMLGLVLARTLTYTWRSRTSPEPWGGRAVERTTSDPSPTGTGSIGEGID